MQRIARDKDDVSNTDAARLLAHTKIRLTFQHYDYFLVPGLGVQRVARIGTSPCSVCAVWLRGFAIRQARPPLAAACPMLIASSR